MESPLCDYVTKQQSQIAAWKATYSNQQAVFLISEMYTKPINDIKWSQFSPIKNYQRINSNTVNYNYTHTNDLIKVKVKVRGFI